MTTHYYKNEKQYKHGQYNSTDASINCLLAKKIEYASFKKTLGTKKNHNEYL